MLTLSNWSKSFGSHQVLKDISLTVPTGQVLSIIGSSGSGKSTLLRTINFLEEPDQGIIQIGQSKAYDVQELRPAEILQLRRQTAMIFQNYALFSKKTALENVMENLLMVQKKSREEAEIIAQHYLAEVGMSQRAHYYPAQLSGGQQQRVGIARALAIQPEVILLDEPTSALDPELVGGILELIQKIAHQETTLLLVTHEMNFAKEVSDQIIFLEGGEILEAGSPDQLFNHPQHPRTQAFLQGFQA